MINRFLKGVINRIHRGGTMRRSKVKRRRRQNGYGTIAIVVLLICGIVLYKRVGLDEKRTIYAKQAQELDQDLKDEKQRTKDLQEEKAYMQTKKYIEEIAREKLGLVYKDEIIFKSNN